MPEFTPADITISILSLAGQIYLLVVMRSLRLWAQWKALGLILSTTAAASIVSLVLLSVDGLTHRTSDLIPALFFYCYWYGALLIAGLQVYLIWQIIGQATGCADRPWLKQAFVAFTLGSMFLALVVTLKAPPPEFHLPVTRVVIAMHRSVSLGWCMLFFSLTAMSDLVGIKWRRQIQAVSAGFVMEAVIDAARSWLSNSSNWTPLNRSLDALQLIVLIFWAGALHSPSYIPLTAQVRRTLAALLAAYGIPGKGQNP